MENIRIVATAEAAFMPVPGDLPDCGSLSAWGDIVLISSPDDAWLQAGKTSIK
jgi:hypothetical protein